MSDLISSPWFESLHTASQVPLAMLAILVFGVGTATTVRGIGRAAKSVADWFKATEDHVKMGWLEASKESVKQVGDLPGAAPNGELCRTILHLLSQPTAWKTAIDTEGRLLKHVNGRLVIRVNGNDVDEIEYILAGVKIADDLTTAEAVLLDKATLERKDAVLAALAACGEVTFWTADAYAPMAATLTGDVVKTPAQLPKKSG